MPGSHNDAILMVELSKFGTMSGVPDAARQIFADDFDPEAADANEPPVRMVLGFFETLGTFVKNDLLDRDLVYDWLAVAAVWARVGPAAKRERARLGIDYLYENVEALAAGQQ
jgi:hypothetical protein